MIAALPMYARAENRAAHDAFWALVRDGLRARGLGAPEALDHDISYDRVWDRPDLVLGHICNQPYRAAYRGKLTVIGASDYGLPGAGPGQYYSQFVVRRDDPAETLADCAQHRLALNSPMSHSGWGAIHESAADIGLTLRPHILTGAHRASAEAVISGAADLAAIDAQCWRMDCTALGFGKHLKVIGRSDDRPGQSFVTAGQVDPAPYRAAIAEALAALPAAHADVIGLRSIVALPDAAYDRPLPPPPKMPARAEAAQ